MFKYLHHVHYSVCNRDAMFQNLEKNFGSWGVDNITQVARDLAAKGKKLRGRGRITQSPRGYKSVNIEPESSLGLWFQLSEGGQASESQRGQSRRPA